MQREISGERPGTRATTRGCLSRSGSVEHVESETSSTAASAGTTSARPSSPVRAGLYASRGRNRAPRGSRSPQRRPSRQWACVLPADRAAGRAAASPCVWVSAKGACRTFPSLPRPSMFQPRRTRNRGRYRHRPGHRASGAVAPRPSLGLHGGEVHRHRNQRRWSPTGAAAGPAHQIRPGQRSLPNRRR